MTKSLLVCCINLQEGRNSATLSRILHLCHEHVIASYIDPVLNRTNITFCGDSGEIVDTVDRISDVCLADIDLRARDGDPKEHHHIGVLDNTPVHPLHKATLADAAGVASRLAGRLNRKGIPTLLYGAAHPEGLSLVELRKQTSFFKSQGDSGVEHSHPLGLCLVGATPYVMSYNMVINTTNIELVSEVVPRVRSKKDGVQAMAYRNVYEGADVVEIACNLLNPDSVPGNSESVLNKTMCLVHELGLTVLYSYSTNPPFESVLDKYLKHINSR